MSNALQIITEAESAGLAMFAVTVTPQDYCRAFRHFSGAENVRTGVGLHPWWLADGRCGQQDAELAAELIGSARYVGEIGLDASPKHVPEGSLPLQIRAFETVCRACADPGRISGPRILSLHSVKAAGLMLDILERTGCLDRCRCIFHWFTGSSDELNRAVRSGCMFSVNEMMLRTRRGREYVRQIPPDRLLTETDLPPGRDIPFSAREITDSLEKTSAEISAIKNTGMDTVIRKNSAFLMAD